VAKVLDSIVCNYGVQLLNFLTLMYNTNTDENSFDCSFHEKKRYGFRLYFFDKGKKYRNHGLEKTMKININIERANSPMMLYFTTFLLRCGQVLMFFICKQTAWLQLFIETFLKEICHNIYPSWACLVGSLPKGIEGDFNLQGI